MPNLGSVWCEMHGQGNAGCGPTDGFSELCHRLLVQNHGFMLWRRGMIGQLHTRSLRVVPEEIPQ